MSNKCNPPADILNKGNKNIAIKELKTLYLAENRRKYPNMPDCVRSYPTWTDKTANGLTKMIIDFIKLKGGQSERINCMGRIVDNRKQVTDVLGNIKVIGSVQYGKTTGQRGTADISATIKGHSVKIEIKIGKDKQSQAQRDYQLMIEKSGGLYFIAKDFEQFYLWYIKTFEA